MSPTRRKPGPDAIRRFVAAQASEPFSYDGVGGTRTGSAPEGFDHDESRVRLGAGQAAFDRARDALRRWAHFNLGWVEIHPADAPVREGTAVAVLIRGLGLWWLNPARILYVEEETTGPVRRLSFAYGTLPGHIERGEERFSVEWRAGEDDPVWYEIRAFSRPAHPLVRLGYPLARLLQRRFVRDSQRAMQEATES